ncbi:MAG: peptidoglycan DD-metalloendopeptidase family protein [Chitinophagales bacterium]|nr:peptidoglycan DD-metalloendopeptidase family protein [Chitinophagales bacterium]
MNKVSANLLLLLLLFCCICLNAQNNADASIPSGGEYIYEKNDAAHPCISAQEYQLLDAEIAQNNQLLHLNNGQQNRIMTTLFSWPLKAAAGFTECGFHFIGAFVDQNTAATSIQDFNCGSNTYDGHKGTDIAVFPYGFYKMDNNQVEVVAAAAGTIIGKSDGNYDRNCSSNNLTANYIIIQHADGSEALYWHMKKNSVTTKSVGQTVVTGEYLGVVGSSGSSSGPHLHFEVWSGSTNATRQDPYSGTCNALNSNSWWITQKPAIDPAVLKVSANTTDLVMSACPATEIPNESTSFTIPFQGAGLPAGYAKFYIFLRDATIGSTIDLKILNPNGTIFNNWTYSPTTFYKASYWGWSKSLPTTAGTYKFQATYNGITCTQNFDIVTSATATITPSGSITFCQGDSVVLTANSGSSYLWNNGATTRSITVKATGSFTVKVTFANGSSATSVATSVTVNALPTATISASGNTTFCQGDSVILTASAGSSYLWNNGATTRSITVKNNGSFSVKVTNANNCSATSAATSVTVNALPTATISASGNTTFCQGDSVILTASAGTSYLWNNGATTRNITVKNSGNFSVKVTNANNCSATSVATSVTVNALPTATISASGNTTFCQGDSVILTASTGSSYLWNNGATTRSITVKNNGNFSVKVTNANNCSATSAATTVTVNMLPTATTSASGSTTFCQGDSVILTASAGSSYLWNNGATTRSITVKNNGSFTVKVTNANNCSATSAASSTTMRSPQNGLSITLRNDTLFAPYTSPVKWYLSGNPNSIDNGLFHVCSSTGNYYVTGHDVNGCTATSNTFLANCNITSISTKTNTAQFDIYPNPTHNIINIKASGIEKGTYKFRLSNIIGQVLSEETINITSGQIERVISMKNLANDIYFISIEFENSMIVRKILKQE